MIIKFLAGVGIAALFVLGLAGLGAFATFMKERKETRKLKFYVTFGQKYRREPHPRLGMAPTLPDGYFGVQAETLEQARSMAYLALGEAWSDVYPLRGDDSTRDALYPLGMTGRITWETINQAEGRNR